MLILLVFQILTTSRRLFRCCVQSFSNWLGADLEQLENLKNDARATPGKSPIQKSNIISHQRHCVEYPSFSWNSNDTRIRRAIAIPCPFAFDEVSSCSCSRHQAFEPLAIRFSSSEKSQEIKRCPGGRQEERHEKTPETSE